MRCAMSDIRGRGMFCHFLVGFVCVLHIVTCLSSSVMFYDHQRCHHEVTSLHVDTHDRTCASAAEAFFPVITIHWCQYLTSMLLQESATSQ